MSKKKQTGLERQDEFIKSNSNKFNFGLVLTEAFVKGMRDIGYKNTSSALNESIDNSIQAQANNIHVIFDWNNGKNGKDAPDRIAIIDDGHGMSPEMLRLAVTWGGSDRLDNREGMGKYGYGLPSSCVSIGQSFTVYSKREDMDNWHSVNIDIEKVGNLDEKYIDIKTGRIVAPIPEITEIPVFVSKHLKKKEINNNHGTIVVIEKIDRLTKRKFFALKNHIIEETGITYRNYLRDVNIFIDGEKVDPIDPLFITEGAKWYDENELRAEALPPLEVKMTSTNGQRHGLVKIRYSLMPYGFFDKDPNVEKKSKDGEIDDTDERTKKNKRLHIRKNNNGIIFLRKGRQIDVVDSRFPWTRFQNNDRHIGIEVDFSPELDEEFSITTSKQQIVVSEEMWNKLHDHGLMAAIQECRRMYKKSVINKIQETSQKPENVSIEEVMTESAKELEVRHDFVPKKTNDEANKNLIAKVRKKAKDADIPEDLAKQLVEDEIEKRPYSLEYFDEEEGPFYRSKAYGSQIVISINRAHRFYTDVYSHANSNYFFRSSLAMMLFSIGFHEARASEDRRKWYIQERRAWSEVLDTALENLSKHFSKSEDDIIMDEEIENTDAELENEENNTNEKIIDSKS